jgi:putative transposase
VLPGIAHHVTQRGNNRQNVFFTDDERRMYLDILEQTSRQFGLCVHGYCLMTNHVHIIAVPGQEESLALGIGRASLRYSMAINKLHGRSGHLWQDRFFSCALDDKHYLDAMRYVERNPVRAKMARRAWLWPWSSAAAHAGKEQSAHPALDMQAWAELGISAEDWRRELVEKDDESFTQSMRHSLRTGWPLGSDSFISKLEKLVGKRLRPMPHGRPAKERF